MAAPRPPPPEPLVVILGTTGVGKSDLAVELARRFNGEVINADAMQMYRGLPIITNKISPEEQRGVPHHLLDIIGLDEPTWQVQTFRREADKVIREIRSRGRLPIVVGGTHFYIDGLLFDDHLVLGDSPLVNDPILDGPTETILAKLREVDPAMADRWQPNDRRKIQHSLQIYLTFGRRASDIYAEQQSRREARREESSTRPWQTLLFWIHSDPEALAPRLNRRVDKMAERGLIDETQSLYDYLHSATARGVAVDRTKGIWQSIGFSQVEPYLDGVARREADDGGDSSLTPSSLEALKQSGIESIKVATRQYARSQVRWIKYKTLRRLHEAHGSALDHVVVLDGTEINDWDQEVAEKAAAVTTRFLAGGSSHDSAFSADSEAENSLASSIAADLMTDAAKAVLETTLSEGMKEKTLCRKTCEVCGTMALTEELWKKHVNGNRHRRAVKRAWKRGLVPDEAVDVDSGRTATDGSALSLQQPPAEHNSDGSLSDSN